MNPRPLSSRPRVEAVGRKRNVLFVCIGNICRSPMAEAFANHYGQDVLRASSAGLAPAAALSPYTRKVMLEKNVDVGDHLPRSFYELDVRDVDLIVNLSGYAIAGFETMDWVIDDPYGGPIEGYRTARDRIELQVMNLILKMRTGKI